MNQPWIYALELTLLGVGFFWLWSEYRSYRLDLLRQRLFAIRDDLFANAAAGIFPMESKAHRMTRAVMNGSIRFAHEFSFARMIAIYVVAKGVGREASTQFRSQLAGAIQELPDHQSRKVVMAALDASHLELAKYLLATSVVVWVMLPILAAWSMLKSAFDIQTAVEATRRFGRQKLRHLDSAVYEAEAY